MKQSDISKRLALELQLSPNDANEIIKQLLGAIRGALMEGEKVYLPPLGTFELRYFLPKNGRHPQTGEPIEIAGYNQPSFRPSPALKNALNR
ncbi:HU family DNA-binding protein [Shewanella sedimentimangrovi]|uniref:HU family DNA-binding protein n=1 Tax=Shewanella sedimentimangrovi TaxID=2814293 RepID=A0ABX7QXW1_9GAMM|nr:HU family DNA-binding protein [Shewanella sedimentimangrovi]QSX35700.1 HU family DNA-binding protein [Shewanella sedimentimangrovi]